VLALASLWLFTPFLSGAAIGSSARARRLVGRHYRALVGLGWLGIALVMVGAFVLPRPQSLVALALGGPLSGLSFWSRRQDGEDGGGEDGDDDPESPPPGGDWERIVRELEQHVERHHGRQSRHGRRPERDRDGSPAPSSPTPV
jgi:hypothetical protein